MSGSVSVMSPQSGSRARRVAAVHIVEVVATCLFLVAVGQIIGGRFEDFAPAPGWYWAMGIGGVVAAVAAGAAVSMSGRHARAEEAALHAKVLDVLYRRSLTGPPAADEGERVITLATDNVERVSEYRQVFLPDILAALATPVLVCLVILVGLDWFTGLVVLLACPLIPTLIGGFVKLFRKRSSDSRRERARLTARYLDALSNLVLIRMLGAGQRVEDDLRRRGETNRGTIMKLLAGNQIVIVVVDGLFSLLFIAMAAGLATTRWQGGDISATSAITIVLLSVLLEPLHQVAAFFYIGMGGIASQKALRKWFDAAPSALMTSDSASSTPTPQRSAHVPVPEDGTIWLRNVSVGYGETEVLHGVSLDITHGGRTAIIGRSGAGKSTLLSVLSGTLPPKSGEVYVSGLDALTAAPGAIRSISASVNQRTWLFAGTVADNLAIPNPNATREQMWDALRRAGVADEVEAMPKGLDSDVGEQGRLMSGGQAQRISLARAFLSGRNILLLDEPTSHVDVDSERRIIDAISQISDNTTVVMVTHRRRLLRLAHDVQRVSAGTLLPADDVDSIEDDRTETEDWA
ncbi:MAG: ATP-binding cassette domain-containing protein [Actinomycetota bacterium]|uniref:ABC transporter ATP-binding protein/permease n=1 Tax=Cutibacterium acnes TaxID=1747 RepID=UPI001C0FC840|nr:ATP-binding cassette domain-containing protein [Cutibacterium acnes]MBU5161403.1 ATP-binding cassette domain-containing protein [Cutibacterium acnes]